MGVLKNYQKTCIGSLKNPKGVFGSNELGSKSMPEPIEVLGCMPNIGVGLAPNTQKILDPGTMPRLEQSGPISLCKVF